MPYYTMPDQESLFVRRVGRGEPVLVLSGLGMQSWHGYLLSMQIVKNTSLLFPTGGALAVQKIVQFPSKMPYQATGKMLLT